MLGPIIIRGKNVPQGRNATVLEQVLIVALYEASRHRHIHVIVANCTEEIRVNLMRQCTLHWDILHVSMALRRAARCAFLPHKCIFVVERALGYRKDMQLQINQSLSLRLIMQFHDITYTAHPFNAVYASALQVERFGLIVVLSCVVKAAVSIFCALGLTAA